MNLEDVHLLQTRTLTTKRFTESKQDKTIVSNQGGTNGQRTGTLLKHMNDKLDSKLHTKLRNSRRLTNF